MTTLSLCVVCILLTFIPSACSGRRFGKCKCYYPPVRQSFEARYWDATSVVSAYVLSRSRQCKSCPNHMDRRNEIMTYKLLLYRVFKGANPGTKFSAQALTNADYCGVRLKNNRVYLLNLNNPQGISKTSHFEKGVYLLDACQSHWTWNAVSRKRRLWLEARRKK